MLGAEIDYTCKAPKKKKTKYLFYLSVRRTRVTCHAYLRRMRTTCRRRDRIYTGCRNMAAPRDRRPGELDPAATDGRFVTAQISV